MTEPVSTDASTAPAPRKARKALTRAKIVETATELFRHNGVRATSIDEIVAAVQITKPTLYRYFPSKNDLVISCLQAEGLRGRMELLQVAESTPEDRGERMRAIAGYFAGQFEATPCRGLFALNLAVEYPDLTCTVSLAIQAEVQNFQDRLGLLIAPKNPSSIEHYTRQLALAVYGASAACQAVGTGASLSLIESVEAIIAEAAQE